jgi:hypothetical protein
MKTVQQNTLRTDKRQKDRAVGDKFVRMRALGELLCTGPRTAHHAEREYLHESSRVVHLGGRMLFHSCTGRLGGLGGGHPLASFFSGLDVDPYDRIKPSREPMGIFHRALCCRPLGLRKYFCDHLLFQWVATAFAMGSHGAFGAAGFAHCRTCLVFKSVGDHRLLVGVFPASRKIYRRCGEVRARLRPDDWVFRRGHGAIPTSLSRPLSANAAPTPALNRANSL